MRLAKKDFSRERIPEKLSIVLQKPIQAFYNNKTFIWAKIKIPEIREKNKSKQKKLILLGALKEVKNLNHLGVDYRLITENNNKRMVKQQ